MDDLNRSIKTVCFTGHRKIDLNYAYKLPSVLKNTITDMIEHGARRFITGGAMGFDTVAALCVIELKEKYPEISLELILPCKDQSKGWNSIGKAAYDVVIAHADSVKYLHDTYVSGCMYERNRSLIDASDICISFCLRNIGGTAYTVSYAKQHGKRVINVADNI